MVTTNYIWDEENYLAETDAADAVQVVYTNEPQEYGNLISQRRIATTSFFHGDAIGSVRQLTSSSGLTTDSFTFSAWGTLVDHDGTTDIEFGWIGQLGYFLDVRANTYYVRARTLDCAIARWTSQDPSRFIDGPNVFHYADNRPTMSVDASGEYSLTLDCPAITAKCCSQKCHFSNEVVLGPKGLVRICWSRTPGIVVNDTGLAPSDGCWSNRDHTIPSATLEVWWEGDNLNSTAPCRVKEHTDLRPDNTTFPRVLIPGRNRRLPSWCDEQILLSPPDDKHEPNGCLDIYPKGNRRVWRVRHQIELVYTCGCGALRRGGRLYNVNTTTVRYAVEIGSPSG